MVISRCSTSSCPRPPGLLLSRCRSHLRIISYLSKRRSRIKGGSRYSVGTAPALGNRNPSSDTRSRNAPCRREDADRGQTEICQVAVQAGNDRPDPSFASESIDQQTKRLNAADQQRDETRDHGDGDVVAIACAAAGPMPDRRHRPSECCPSCPLTPCRRYIVPERPAYASGTCLCAAWVAATPRRIARLMMETDVSMARPIALNASGPPCAAAIVAAIASEVRTTTVE
jgi:hypothetical protein